MLERCYRGVTEVLQRWYRGVADVETGSELTRVRKRKREQRAETRDKRQETRDKRD
jgi:hypothetical protein